MTKAITFTFTFSWNSDKKVNYLYYIHTSVTQSTL